MGRPIRIGIVLFHEVEVLDFAGPFEVFSVTRDESGNQPFEVCTIAQGSGPIKARNGLAVQPKYTFENAPSLDVLIVPGGYGAEEIEIHNSAMIAFIKRQGKSVELLASVCTGAFLLAQAGLLDGRSATTHWMDLDRLEREYPLVNVKRGVRYVDEGAIVTSAGISAGIAMSLHIVARLLGEQTAKMTARRMEYGTSL